MSTIKKKIAEDIRFIILRNSCTDVFKATRFQWVKALVRSSVSSIPDEGSSELSKGKLTGDK